MFGVSHVNADTGCSRRPAGLRFRLWLGRLR